MSACIQPSRQKVPTRSTVKKVATAKVALAKCVCTPQASPLREVGGYGWRWLRVGAAAGAGARARASLVWLDAADRERVRRARDERARAKLTARQLPPLHSYGLAESCYEAARGDPVRALTLAIAWVRDLRAEVARARRARAELAAQAGPERLAGA